ncbi:hypothetical protein NQ315_000672 [Exocentrus adspersus]|uniref:Double jelly roll-like domain-containing protein n=1 Tax=Exocentrus adspersus TaxID=1586481 RepID=A0AAV8VMX2_9CUCU|nr:hypothetical protein NQ315_000672 [Exocentrus adspersus]
MSFRSWELTELPSLSENTKHMWPVKTTTKMETPGHAVIALQTGKKENIKANMCEFDHCKLTNVKRYSYNDLFLDFENNKFATLYEMFVRFRQAYYEKENEPIFTPKQFKEIAPIVYIDCSGQRRLSNQELIELETKDNVPKDKAAYCLVMHDQMCSYNLMTKIVKQE